MIFQINQFRLYIQFLFSSICFSNAIMDFTITFCSYYLCSEFSFPAWILFNRSIRSYFSAISSTTLSAGSSKVMESEFLSVSSPSLLGSRPGPVLQIRTETAAPVLSAHGWARVVNLNLKTLSYQVRTVQCLLVQHKRQHTSYDLYSFRTVAPKYLDIHHAPSVLYVQSFYFPRRLSMRLRKQRKRIVRILLTPVCQDFK